MNRWGVWGVTFGAVWSLACFAGNETHGGDIVVCKGKDPVVLDYYHAALKGFGEGTPNIVDISGWDRRKVVAFFQEQLKSFVFGARFEEALLQVGDLDSWIEADLKEVDDSDEPYLLPEGCERKQGAVRQGNEMYVDPLYVKQLSSAQQGMLVVHEAVYWIASAAGQHTSVHVRELIRSLLRKDTSSQRLIRSIHALKGIAYSFEALPNRRYVSKCGSTSPDLFFSVLSASDRKLSASLYGGELLPFIPAELACDLTGLKCLISKGSSAEGSATSWVGGTMEIENRTHALKFTHPNGDICRYHSANPSPYFP